MILHKAERMSFSSAFSIANQILRCGRSVACNLKTFRYNPVRELCQYRLIDFLCRRKIPTWKLSDHLSTHSSLQLLYDQKVVGQLRLKLLKKLFHHVSP